LPLLSSKSRGHELYWTKIHGSAYWIVDHQECAEHSYSIRSSTSTVLKSSVFLNPRLIIEILEYCLHENRYICRVQVVSTTKNMSCRPYLTPGIRRAVSKLRDPNRMLWELFVHACKVPAEIVCAFAVPDYSLVKRHGEP
jgi:hypothetical protein